MATQLNGRLLDIHSVYNVAFALTEFESRAFRDTVEKVEAITHDLILKLPPDEPVILTTVLAGDSDWGAAEWQRITALGQARPPLCVVHIHCDREENIRRIQSENRDLKRKPRDPAYVLRNHAEAKPLLGADANRLLKLDTTTRTAMQSASTIADWLTESQGG